MYTEARAREGVRNTSGITQKRQARGGAHLGLHCNHRVPQVGTSQPEVWSRRSVPFTGIRWAIGYLRCGQCVIFTGNRVGNPTFEFCQKVVW